MGVRGEPQGAPAQGPTVTGTSSASACARARLTIRLRQQDVDYGDELIASGEFASWSELVRYLLARHRTWVEAGYPPRFSLRCTPEQAAHPARRILPRDAN